MVRSILLAASVAVFLCAGAATADVLWYQPVNHNLTNITSQIMSDLGVATYAFDDFSTGSATWEITRVTIFGIEVGDLEANQAVKLAFTSEANSSAIGVTFDGMQVGNNLIFDMPGLVELSGDFWLTAWVERPVVPSGQWFWELADQTYGSQFYLHNPDDYWGYGSAPNPGETYPIVGSPADLAFKIEGRVGCETVIPEASSLMLALGALPAVAAVTRYRRSK